VKRTLKQDSAEGGFMARLRRLSLAPRSSHLPNHIIDGMRARDAPAFRGRSEMSGRFKDFHWR